MHKRVHQRHIEHPFHFVIKDREPVRTLLLELGRDVVRVEIVWKAALLCRRQRTRVHGYEAQRTAFICRTRPTGSRGAAGRRPTARGQLPRAGDSDALRGRPRRRRQRRQLGRLAGRERRRERVCRIQ